MDKKDKIIEAAIKVFKKNGIADTKVSDIVKIAGIAQGTFYLYFPSKLSVIPHIAEKVVRKMEKEIKQTVTVDAPFEIKLEQIINCVFKLNQNYRDIFALIYSGITQSEHMKEWESIYDPFYKWMKGFLDDYKKQGIISGNINTEITAKLLIASIESAAEQVYLFDEAKEEKIVSHKKELLKFLSNALGVVSD